MSKANDLTKSIVTFLNLSGWKVWRQNNVGIFDTKKKVFRSGNNLKGVSDIIGFNKKTAQFIAVEVKIGKDKLSEPQTDFLASVISSGGVAIVAKSFDGFMEAYKEQIKEVLKYPFC